MASAKSRSKHHNELCKQYRDRGTGIKNKVRKIKAHQKAHPGDKQNQAINLGAVKLTRRTPKISVWSRETKEFAHTLRLLGHNGSNALIKRFRMVM